MARKIFVSYKHSDDSVKSLDYYRGTVRSYVDKLVELFDGDEIYKGEGNEDLSSFKDETIANHLRDKIYDSSLTLVLISPQMKELFSKESDQWIPWEVAYSLKEITRGGRTSKTNALLAVVLPDRDSSYSYYLEENTCPYCHCMTLHTQRLFQILRENMFNVKQPTYNGCSHHLYTNPVYTGRHSYIDSAKWEDFLRDKEKYLEMAEYTRERIVDYEITKIVRG